MAKDYVARPRTSNRRKSKRPVKNKQGFPFGLAVVVLIAIVGFAWGLYSIQGSAPTQETPVVKAPAKAPSTTKKPNALPEKPQQRAYIEELENREVIVESNPNLNQASKPYQMQCASFRGRDKAEETKAMIAFSGLESSIKRSEGKNGVWYRVVLGPYPRKRDAERDRHILQNAKIDGCSIWYWNWD
ncbi:cell division protein [Alginatibacterium sediminis]|uniref:Cell division protein n=1 Tax=Alginatibacterium sediminis TaxID=2164068 RepID=A0A420E681_9ALTE|nr:SPOR domain-containing protein [Alginatibacterium sediminis]RKF13121.1 cell division protein [Alginatibacterium sediminis]